MKKLALLCFITLMMACNNARVHQYDLTLWELNTPVPKMNEIPLLENVELHVIKKRQKEIDQYNFLHGVALAWHQERLYASFAHNKGDENTGSEEARYCVSEDMGQSWSDVMTIDSGDEDNLAVSHGVFLSDGDKLWAFHGSFHGRMQNVHMRAYWLDEKNGEWQKMGVVAEDGFWPLDKPTRMDNGNWIIGGISVGKTSNIHGPNQSAVAISNGDNFLKWDVIKIDKADGVGKIWGESSNIVDGSNVLNISRYGDKKIALVAQSNDFGRSWSKQHESNLPMITSKPFCGKLSTGHSYIINSIASDIEGRHPLTIAIRPPGEKYFSQLFCIRNDMVRTGYVESAPNSALSYPYAIENDGKLYVAYSNDGGRGKNLNSAELAVIPISELTKSKDDDCRTLACIPDTLHYATNYDGHLQGMATDYKSHIFWSHTTQLVKTDFRGNVIKVLDVPFHHGDLDYYDGKIYVAVNFGLFNDENGKADSWIYVYDAQNLNFLKKYSLPEVVFGAGGIAIHNNRAMVIGGLPYNGKFNENFVYEYSMNFELDKVHKLKTGYTHQGIQTAAYYNGFWYFGCYGNKSKSLNPVVLKAALKQDSLNLIKMYQKDFSFGLIGLYDDKWLNSNLKSEYLAHVTDLKE